MISCGNRVDKLIRGRGGPMTGGRADRCAGCRSTVTEDLAPPPPQPTTRPSRARPLIIRTGRPALSSFSPRNRHPESHLLATMAALRSISRIALRQQAQAQAPALARTYATAGTQSLRQRLAELIPQEQELVKEVRSKYGQCPTSALSYSSIQRWSLILRVSCHRQQELR